MVRRRVEVGMMLQTSVKEEIVSILDELTPEEQRRVLNFARSISTQLPEGISGTDFRRFAGLFPPEDLAEMAAAIEEGCENIDPEGW